MAIPVERIGTQELYRTSRDREVRQISSQIGMMMQRARVMGEDVTVDPAMQNVIAKRDQLERDLSALSKAETARLPELRGRIDAQIDELEKLSRATRTNAQRR